MPIEADIVRIVTGQGRYCFKVVVINSRSGARPDIWHREPRAFDGTADQFAEAVLDEILASEPELAWEQVRVTVWDCDNPNHHFSERNAVGRTYYSRESRALEAARETARQELRRRFPTVSSMPALPFSTSLVLRTDFSDDAAWDAFREAADAEMLAGGMEGLSFHSDPAYAGLTGEQAAALDTKKRRGHVQTYVFLADHATITDPEMPFIAVDLCDEPGRWFRVAAHRLPNVLANLYTGNMPFREYADAVDPDGVFRGFPGQQR